MGGSTGTSTVGGSVGNSAGKSGGQGAPSSFLSQGSAAPAGAPAPAAGPPPPATPGLASSAYYQPPSQNNSQLQAFQSAQNMQNGTGAMAPQFGSQSASQQPLGVAANGQGSPGLGIPADVLSRYNQVNPANQEAGAATQSGSQSAMQGQTGNLGDAGPSNESGSQPFQTNQFLNNIQQGQGALTNPQPGGTQQDQASAMQAAYNAFQNAQGQAQGQPSQRSGNPFYTPGSQQFASPFRANQAYGVQNSGSLSGGGKGTTNAMASPKADFSNPAINRAATVPVPKKEEVKDTTKDTVAAPDA